MQQSSFITLVISGFILFTITVRVSIAMMLDTGIF